jgi:fatty-acyl-CoA synthase
VPQPGAPDPASGAVALARSRLAGFKTPRHVVLVESLPKNASGKVLKAELRRWLTDNPELLGERG